jgi:UDPglucose--hexose-1-phosphate uridylyltransferase
MSEGHTSELRHDRLGGRTVIVAAGRAARPNQFTSRATAATDDARAGDCPFCPGQEEATPPEVARTGPGDAGDPDWRVRVFPNLYPIVGGHGAGPGTTGVHEVVALSPGHHVSLGELDDAHAAEVFLVLRDRVRTHLTSGHAFGLAIVNHRRAAGASIAHPHAQVFALDLVPPAVEAAVARFADAGDDLVLLDAHAGSPVLGDGAALPGVLAWSPYAASSPALVRIAMTTAGPDFAGATDEQIVAVAHATRAVLARLGTWLADPPYNLVVHGAPPGTAARGFHWYVEIIPRVSVVAGFEQGTGVLVNTMPPDQAAEALRTRTPS